MRIILLEPEIPQNTGNIARICAALDAELILAGRLGFILSDKHLRRAGMDYWGKVKLTLLPTLNEFYPLINDNCAFISTKAAKLYTELPEGTDTLIFGSESSGLPPRLYGEYPDQLYRIPMKQDIRSLNLATSVGIVAYHAAAKNNFHAL